MGDDVHLPWLCASPYSLEFRLAAVELYRTSGRPPSEVAPDLGVPERSLVAWADRYAADADEPASRERDEVLRSMAARAARERGWK